MRTWVRHHTGISGLYYTTVLAKYRGFLAAHTSVNQAVAAKVAVESVWKLAKEGLK